MIRFMRVRFKSLRWILWAVIASFVLWIFVAWGMGRGGGSGDSGESRTIALEVDGQIVTRTDFMRQVQQTEQSYRQQFGEQADAFLKQLNIREQVLNQLITRKIALREAGRAGLRVTDPEVRAYLLKSFVDEQGEFIGAEKLERAARRQGLTPNDFRDAVAEDLLYRKFQGLIEAGVVVGEDEVKGEYLRRNDKAKVDYVYQDAKALAGSAAVSDADLQRFYDEHKNRFEKEERKAAYVIFAASDFTAKAVPSEADLRQAYDERSKYGEFEEQRRARHLLLKTEGADAEKKKAIEARAVALTERAKKGEDFEALARANSEDAGSASKGGDLGFFGHGRMVKPFEEAVFEMKPGEVRGPVESPFGFHVIKLEEVQPAKTFEEARTALDASVRKEQARKLARAAATAAATKHKDDGDLAALAGEAGKKVQETAFLRDDMRSAAIPGVDATALSGFLRALFAIPQPGKLAADPVPSGDDSVVVKLAEKRGPVVPPFADVKATVDEAFRADQGRVEAKKKLLDISAQMVQGKSFEDAAKAQGLEVKSSTPFARGSAIPGIPRSEEAAKIAWELEPGKVGGPVDLPAGVALVRASERFQFDPAKFAGEKDSLRTELETNKRYELSSALIRAARKDLEARKKLHILARDLVRKPGQPAEGPGDEDEVF